jgi:membrane protein DedA with SNARE-associated domain
MITALLDHLAALPFPLLVLAAGLLALGETTIGLGFVVPGESGLLVVSAAVRGVEQFVLVTAVVAVCAATGDAIGYAVGRRYGDRLRDSRLIARLGRQHWDRAGDLLRRRGAWAVLGARFLPVVRTVTPAAAGAAGLPLNRFLPASAVGALGWSALHIGIGAGAGAAAREVEKALGSATWVVLAVLVAAGVGAVLVRRRRAAVRQPG